jgi:hypothetical protein
MPTSRGTVYLASKIFVEQTYGTEAVEQVLGSMNEKDRAFLHSINAVGYYDLAPMLRFQRSADRLLGDGSLAVCREMGRFSADWQLNLFHKVMLRMKRPSYLLERAGSVWQRYHSQGRWEVSNVDGVAVGKLFEFGANDRSFCVRLEGWMARAFELCGARSVEVTERQCCASGDRCCEFRIDYTD